MIDLKFKYPVYPVYYFSFNWSEPIEEAKKKIEDIPENWLVDQPEGYFRNSTGFGKMFKETPNEAEIDSIVSKYIEQLEQTYPGVINIQHKIKFKGNFSWHLTWFTHETFDIGQTDQEALLSFHDYVETIQNHNDNYDEFTEAANRIALMGAEETWRWRGADPLTGKDEGHNHSAPCRCIHCKEHGMIRIMH